VSVARVLLFHHATSLSGFGALWTQKSSRLSLFRVVFCHVEVLRRAVAERAHGVGQLNALQSGDFRPSLCLSTNQHSEVPIAGICYVLFDHFRPLLPLPELAPVPLYQLQKIFGESLVGRVFDKAVSISAQHKGIALVYCVFLTRLLHVA
jgi:hypothetical protein